MWTVERRRGTHYCIERSSSEVSHDLRLVYERDRWWWHWLSSSDLYPETYQQFDNRDDALKYGEEIAQYLNNS